LFFDFLCVCGCFFFFLQVSFNGGKGGWGQGNRP